MIYSHAVKENTCCPRGKPNGSVEDALRGRERERGKKVTPIDCVNCNIEHTHNSEHEAQRGKYNVQSTKLLRSKVARDTTLAQLADVQSQLRLEFTKEKVNE